MHHPHDEYFKNMMRWCIELESDVEIERVVHVPPQRIDLAYSYRSRASASDLGLVGEMLALGPGMMEYFAQGASPRDIKACVRKRLSYEHERALAAERRREPAPPEPWLWILCTSQPRAALQAYAAEPMNGWPAGFWESRREPRMRFVVLSELPESPETLLLRVFGRGTTMTRAMAQIEELPAGHRLGGRLAAGLLAFKDLIMQAQRSDMYTSEEIRERYEAWERNALEKGRKAALRDVLIGQLTQRFGGVPEDALVRIHEADPGTLMRWASRVLTAASLDDLLE